MPPPDQKFSLGYINVSGLMTQKVNRDKQMTYQTVR